MDGVADKEAENGPLPPETERDGQVRSKDVDFEPPKKLPTMPPKLAKGEIILLPKPPQFTELATPLTVEPKPLNPLAMVFPTEDPTLATLLTIEVTPLATEFATLEIPLPIE